MSSSILRNVLFRNHRICFKMVHSTQRRQNREVFNIKRVTYITHLQCMCHSDEKTNKQTNKQTIKQNKQTHQQTNKQTKETISLALPYHVQIKISLLCSILQVFHLKGILLNRHDLTQNCDNH